MALVGGASNDKARSILCTAFTETPALTGFLQVEEAEIGGKGPPPPRRALDSRPVKRAAAAFLSIVAMMLVAAPAAFAENGVGLAGPTTDKTVTFFCFGVMGFFVILVIGLSLIQGRLEKRKEQRRSDLSRLG